MTKDANQIASEYARSGYPTAYRPRTGTFTFWEDGDLTKDPLFVSNHVTAQVHEGGHVSLMEESGAIEVIWPKPGAYASFVYDDEGE